MPIHPWKCLNCSDYARALNMPDHLKMFDKFLKTWVLNKPGFWVWHGCICKSSTMPEYCWMSLNTSENNWINCSDYARVLNMPQYSYSIIINVTNYIRILVSSIRTYRYSATILSFLTAVHCGWSCKPQTYTLRMLDYYHQNQLYYVQKQSSGGVL